MKHLHFRWQNESSYLKDDIIQHDQSPDNGKDANIDVYDETFKMRILKIITDTKIISTIFDSESVIKLVTGGDQHEYNRNN